MRTRPLTSAALLTFVFALALAGSAVAAAPGAPGPLYDENGKLVPEPFPPAQGPPRLKEQGLRFELPYQERIKRHGSQLASRLHEVGIEWWEKQLEEYEPLVPRVFANVKNSIYVPKTAAATV